MFMKPRLAVKAALCRKVAIAISVVAYNASGIAAIDKARAAQTVEGQLRVTSEKAKQILAVAEAEAMRHSWNVCIAVVDTNGDLVHFLRMDGSPVNSSLVGDGTASWECRFD
jgi:heme-degrading protein